MIRCKNNNCNLPLSKFEIDKLSNVGNSQQSRYRFCIKCRKKFGRNRNISIETKCVDCGGLMVINHWTMHKCKQCVTNTRKLKVRRNYDKKRRPVVYIHRKIIDMLERSAPNDVKKDDIIRLFGLTEDSFKQHMRLVKKQVKITRTISYRIDNE